MAYILFSVTNFTENKWFCNLHFGSIEEREGPRKMELKRRGRGYSISILLMAVSIFESRSNDILSNIQVTVEAKNKDDLFCVLNLW